ncbi:hypothetical protein [uncultured Winogradskyella sp.]|uniref:hypothetical protein n=1 Tax=uncultured Winogradskyella sp. TaxID=395353 RepID=UPI0026163378|nr:hypothetical protein [uncultured Winogradskyella sp.]
MTEKEIRLEITKRISQGESKSSLYEYYKTEIKDETLRSILATRPSYEHWKKFKVAHLMLSLIWGVFILFELTGIFDLMMSFDIKLLASLLLSMYVTFNIWKFDGRFFLPGIVWFSFTIIRMFSELGAPDLVEDADLKFGYIFALIYSVILSVGIYLMYYIRKNAFSYMKWFKPIINQDGDIQFE